MTQEKLKELAAGYCLDALEGEEKVVFEKLLKNGNPKAVQFYREMQQTVSFLPHAAEPVSPPAFLKARILADINTETESKSPKRVDVGDKIETAVLKNLEKLALRWKRISFAVTFASILLLASTFWYFSERENQLSADKEQAIFALQQQIDSFEQNLQEKERLLTLVKSYENAIFTLSRLGKNLQQANVKVVVAPSQSKAVFIGSDVKPPPQGKVYLLWKLHDSQPINAGIWQVDTNGNLIYELGNITDDITDFAVTIESDKGAETLNAPTSDIELYVKI